MAVSLRKHSSASMAVTAACIPRLTTSWLYCSVGSEWMELGPAICRTAHARLVTLNCMPLNPEFRPGSGVRLAGSPWLKRSSTSTATSALPQLAMEAKSIFQVSSRRAMWPP